MAIKTTNAEEMKKAVLKRIEQILDNIQYGTEFYIDVRSYMGSLPTINYQVKETIPWDSEDTD